MNVLASYFSAAGFLPHGFCLLWRPDILALHAISDLVIAISYFSIPLAILWFVRRRQDLIADHKRIAVLFSVFILGCGLTHVLGVVVLWTPIYALDGLVKAFTAAASIVTAIVLWPMLPRLLQIPSPNQLASANANLQLEVAAKERALAELEAIRSSLAAEASRRGAQLQTLAQRFAIATEGSVITVCEQDAELRYTWLHNPRPPFSSDAVGRTDADVLEAASAAVLTPLKQRVLDTGEPLRTEVSLPMDGGERHFELKITPAEVGEGGRGLLVAAVDISDQKQQQQHLEVIMRELAHRAKNLLSLVQGIARQTAKAEGLPEGFIARFGARLAALGSAHDLLVNRDWRGVDIAVLVGAQLTYLLPEERERIWIGGPSLIVSPETGQYLALALHELATNATKYGALSQANGGLEVRWRARTRRGRRRIEVSWTERGVQMSPPLHSGFGRLLLERLVPRGIRGETTLEFTPDGVRWVASFDQ